MCRSLDAVQSHRALIEFAGMFCRKSGGCSLSFLLERIEFESMCTLTIIFRLFLVGLCLGWVCRITTSNHWSSWTSSVCLRLRRVIDSFDAWNSGGNVNLCSRLEANTRYGIISVQWSTCETEGRKSRLTKTRLRISSNTESKSANT